MTLGLGLWAKMSSLKFLARLVMFAIVLQARPASQQPVVQNHQWATSMSQPGIHPHSTHHPQYQVCASLLWLTQLTTAMRQDILFSCFGPSLNVTCRKFEWRRRVFCCQKERERVSDITLSNMSTYCALAVACGCWTTGVQTSRATGNNAAISATGTTASAAKTPYRRGQACRTKEGGFKHLLLALRVEEVT